LIEQYIESPKITEVLKEFLASEFLTPFQKFKNREYDVQPFTPITLKKSQSDADFYESQGKIITS